MVETRILEVNYEGVISYVETKDKPGKYANKVIQRNNLTDIKRTRRIIENPTLEIQECNRFLGNIKPIIGTKVTYININN